MVLGANLHPLTSTPAQGWPRRWLHGLRSWLRPRPAAPRALPAPAPAPAPTPDPLARARQEAHEAEAEGRWDAAIRAWGTIVANVSGDVPARLRLAEAFMAAEQPSRGLATLREALALVRRQDRPDELLAIARHVLHHDRKDRSLTVEVVRLLVRRGEADEAALVLDRHFAACPPDATLLLTLERGAKGGVSALILERAARAALARSDDPRVTAVSARVLGLPAPTRAALEEPTGRISNDALAGLLRASQPPPGLESAGADEHAVDELLASITPDPAGICTRKVDAIVVDLVVAESRVDNARA